jgi:hypothetical protein
MGVGNLMVKLSYDLFDERPTMSYPVEVIEGIACIMPSRDGRGGHLGGTGDR